METLCDAHPGTPTRPIKQLCAIRPTPHGPTGEQSLSLSLRRRLAWPVAETRRCGRWGHRRRVGRWISVGGGASRSRLGLGFASAGRRWRGLKGSGAARWGSGGAASAICGRRVGPKGRSDRCSRGQTAIRHVAAPLRGSALGASLILIRQTQNCSQLPNVVIKVRRMRKRSLELQAKKLY
jgi:hypothetical protein